VNEWLANKKLRIDNFKIARDSLKTAASPVVCVIAPDFVNYTVARLP